MKPVWKDPKKESPVKDGESSVCVMVSPGCYSALHPMKAWWDGKSYWLASGDKAEVVAWDYYPDQVSK